MKKIISILLIATMSVLSISAEDPSKLFEQELLEFKEKKDLGLDLFVGGTIGLLVSILSQSTIISMEDSGYFKDNILANNVKTGTYFTIPISAIITFIGGYMWVKNTDDYQETLNLRMQYINMVN